ncbi:MAG: hypothetical protein BHV69_09990 [Bacteroidales bacterium 52_46]|nr:MAG: hypothetical protein BHV69_09990 [Bacteroidales bacterium 52_46]
MNTNFETIKSEILRRAKEAHACTEQFSRAYKSENMAQLCTVIKDNFWWACNNKVLTVDLLEQYKIEFAEHEIYVNVSVERGFMLCDSATVKAYGSATVEAYGSATVKAYDSATVEAWGSATVKAYDRATVEAWGSWGSATVEAWGSATVEAWGSATVEAWGSATVKAYGSATVKAYDSATVEAWDNAYCTSYSTIECKLSDNAIYRVRSSNIVYYASDDIKFEKQ